MSVRACGAKCAVYVCRHLVITTKTFRARKRKQTKRQTANNALQDCINNSQWWCITRQNEDAHSWKTFRFVHNFFNFQFFTQILLFQRHEETADQAENRLRSQAEMFATLFCFIPHSFFGESWSKWWQNTTLLTFSKTRRYIQQTACRTVKGKDKSWRLTWNLS